MSYPYPKQVVNFNNPASIRLLQEQVGLVPNQVNTQQVNAGTGVFTNLTATNINIGTVTIATGSFTNLYATSATIPSLTVVDEFATGNMSGANAYFQTLAVNAGIATTKVTIRDLLAVVGNTVMTGALTVAGATNLNTLATSSSITAGTTLSGNSISSTTSISAGTTGTFGTSVVVRNPNDSNNLSFQYFPMGSTGYYGAYVGSSLAMSFIPI
jgi:hypothetical protein